MDPGNISWEGGITIQQTKQIQYWIKYLNCLMIVVQGIEIAIGELTGPTDCSTDYLEVSSNQFS